MDNINVKQDALLDKAIDRYRFAILLSDSLSEYDIKRYFDSKNIRYVFVDIDDTEDMPFFKVADTIIKKVFIAEEIRNYNLLIDRSYSGKKITTAVEQDLLCRTLKMLEEKGRCVLLLYPAENILNKKKLLCYFKSIYLNDLYNQIKFFMLSKKEVVTADNMQPFVLYSLDLNNDKIMDIVFISYKWNDVSQNIVYNQLIPAMSKYNIGYEVDKNDCNYMENIRYFEERIGRGGKIVAVVSKEYLYSVHCMYEIASVLANGNPEGRLFLLIVDDFDRSDSEYGDLVRYWKQEKEKLSIFKSEFSDIGKDGIEIEDRYISLICSQIGNIWSCICDYNTVTITDIAKNDFEMLRTKMGFKNNIEMIKPDVNNITTGTEPNRKIVMTGKNAQYIEINSGNNININSSSEI